MRIEHLTLDEASTVGTTIRRAPKGTGSKREVRPGVWQLTVNAGSCQSDRSAGPG